MKRFLAGAWRLLRGLPLALLSPILLLARRRGAVLWGPGLLLRRSRENLPTDTTPNHRTASVVIPNWNGRDLLEKYLPSVIAALSDFPEAKSS